MSTQSLRFRMTAWYAGLLTVSLVVFCASVFLGLRNYLNDGLRDNLAEQTRSIGEKLLADVSVKGEQYVISETNEHYAPEINGRFIRITRLDNSILYQSSLPTDRTFNPNQIPIQQVSLSSVGFRTEKIDNTILLIHIYPYTTKDGKSFLIEAGAPRGAIGGVLRRLLMIFGIGLPVIVFCAIAGGYWLMRRALHPVNLIAEQAERISSRNLNERLPALQSGDEIEKLSIALNRMIERLDDAFQHINRFTADVSHELRTPLTILRGELETLAQQRVSTSQMEIIGSALEETERLANIVEQLLAISRLDAGEACRERIRLDLGELATSTADQLHLLADEKAISLQYLADSGVYVEADPLRLRQIIANLLDNAIKYTREGGAVKLSVFVLENQAILEVEDNGAGIPSEALSHIFDRFYRADQARSRSSGGVGLGLAIVKAICSAHGATIRVSSEERVGTCFRVSLPLAEGPIVQKSANVTSLRKSGVIPLASKDGR